MERRANEQADISFNVPGPAIGGLSLPWLSRAATTELRMLQDWAFHRSCAGGF